MAGGFDIGCKIKILGYANDLNVIASNRSDVEDMVSTVVEAGKKSGLKINTQKTKYLQLSRRPNGEDASIGGHVFENVKEFRHLGSIITSDNNVS